MDKMADDVYSHILSLENKNMQLSKLLVMYHAVWISDMDDNLREIYNVKKNKNDDGTFTVQMSLPMNKPVSVNYPMKYWKMFKCQVDEGLTPNNSLIEISEMFDILKKHISLNI